jgi:hypothetical protein
MSRLDQVLFRDITSISEMLEIEKIQKEDWGFKIAKSFKLSRWFR